MSGRKVSAVTEEELMRGFKYLKRLGITDKDWRRMVANPDTSKQVVAAIRAESSGFAGSSGVDEHPVPADNPAPARDERPLPKTWSGLLGRFSSDHMLDAEYRPEWTDLGDSVRGEFVLLKMGRVYREEHLEFAVRQLSREIGKPLLLATVYELAAFGNRGWNGRDSVVAFCSRFVPGGAREAVARLFPRGKTPRLFVDWADGAWGPEHYVLCVVDEAASQEPPVPLQAVQA